MNCFPIRLGDDAQVFANFWNQSPTTNSSVCLHFSPNWIPENEFDPFLFEVRTASHDFGCEIVCRFQIVTIRPLIACGPISRIPIVPFRPLRGTIDPGLKSSTAPCILMYGSWLCPNTIASTSVNSRNTD